MRVHHLNCATFCPLGGHFFDGRTPGLRRARLVCHCLLIETADRLILVDTGLGLNDVSHPHPRLSRGLTALLHPRYALAETAHAQIAALGYSTADVRDIVLTHLDFDHAGGIQDFPRARVHVYAEELQAALHASERLARRRYRRSQWGHNVRWIQYRTQGETWFGFDCVHQLAQLPPEILMLPLPGHTAGHCGIAVDDGQRWQLLAGDAYFHHDELHAAEPSCPAGLGLYQSLMQTDRDARLDNRRRLRELSRSEPSVRIFCSHDAAEFDRLHVSVPAYVKPVRKPSRAV